ncbi:hypothetical protein [Glycomyces sp. MUSA5-2]|uniref:hypothetical protein n=1 Tax=Glycomyces sp. MUSA5-2 TaxID=2053002 RepID=UPI003009C8F4
MSTQNEATRDVADFFTRNQGEYDIEAIVYGAEVTKAQANRALTSLVKDGTLTVTGTGTDRRWTLAPAPEEGDDPAEETAPTAPSDHEADSTTADEASEADADESGTAQAASEESEEAEAPTADATESKNEGTGEGDIATSESDSGEGQVQKTEHDKEEEDEDGGEESTEAPTLPIEPEPDPDPQILYYASVIANIGAPFDTQTLCDKAYTPTKRRAVTTILRAMAEHGLVRCSKPFAPDADDAVWELVYDKSLMDAVVRVQVADAPDHLTCEVCGQTKTFGGAPRPRPAGSNVRNDGRTILAAGELTGYVIDYVTDPENTGVEFTVRQITKALVALHPGKVSDNSDGAIKNALDKMCRKDPRRARYADRALVQLVRPMGPRTYRALWV